MFDVLELEDQFKKKWENNSFEFLGVNWWPIIKTQVCFQIQLMNIRPIDESNFDTFSDLKLPTHTFGKRAYLNLFKNKIKKVDNRSEVAVFTLDSHISVPYKDSLINPFTYPFLDFFDKNHISYKVFQFWNSDGFAYNNEIILRYYRKQVVEKFNKNKSFQLKLYALCEELKITISPRFDLYDLLANLIVDNQINYLSYLLFFKKYKFKKVLAYCYYDTTVMAIFRAANELGIPTIEYQHSQVSASHFAYSGWDTSIKDSSGFFPSLIWAWGECDVQFLKKEFSALPSFDAIVGGNLGLSMFHKESKYKENNAEIKVLIAFQGMGIPDYILSLISKLKHVKWMLRLHPRYPQDKEIMIQIKKENNDSVDIDNANSLSIYELFTEVDYLLTCSSGSAIEAQSFGVTNIIYDLIGYKTYKDQIEKELYFFIRNEDDLKDILENKKKTKQDFDPLLIDALTIENNIKTVFK